MHLSRLVPRYVFRQECDFAPLWHACLTWLFLGIGVSAPLISNAAQPHPDTPTASDEDARRPNIVWIVVEDMSPHFSCYGETTVSTPHVDALAHSGVRFTRAFVTAPICSISRSALITGHYQTTLGVHNHRSSVPGHEIRLPSDVPLIPELFKSHGYHVSNLTWESFHLSDEQLAKNPSVPIAKTDYNFEWDTARSYHATHWTHRAENQPFFLQIQLHGGKFRGQSPQAAWPKRVLKALGSTTPASSVVLPRCLPDDPVLREDWAQYLDCVRFTDYQLGTIVDRLRSSGDLDQTVLFFLTDHGISHVRHKQFLYDGGTHVPLIIAGAGIPAGQIREDLVEHIDLAATSLALAGIEKPARMASQDLLSSNYEPREAVFAARDRADETVDWIRSARTERHKYIRNGFPDRPYLQPNAYKDSKAIVQTMRALHRDGKLNRDHALILADSRPREELYDLANDPDELHNLADDPAFATQLATMRSLWLDWQNRTGDIHPPESAEVYELEAGADHLEGGKGNRSPAYQANLELMRRWRTEKPFRGEH